MGNGLETGFMQGLCIVEAPLGTNILVGIVDSFAWGVWCHMWIWMRCYANIPVCELEKSRYTCTGSKRWQTSYKYTAQSLRDSKSSSSYTELHHSASSRQQEL